MSQLSEELDDELIRDFMGELSDAYQAVEEAAVMVEQHHEWFNGGGYPNGLSAAAIHPGAGIIAIADTFESMTHMRADREHKRSVLRAVAEINGMAGKQFDPQWVQHFNAVVRRRYVNRG